ncbi:MAG TPA: transposase, partial [Ktedonobacterales bacterium]|nr:transposase [Ktedonobacterales bacterium]
PDEASDEEPDGRWRAKAELAPADQVQNSPYDPDARYGKKRETSWVGYKLHVTESCAADAPHLIVQVTTTPACAADAAALAPIQAHLADRHLLPSRQLVDAGYVDAEVLATSHARFGVDVLGPTRGNFRWQARQQTGFEGQHFTVDWAAQRVICPQGHTSRSWTPLQDRRHVHTRDMLTVAFSAHDCRPCPRRAQCTRSAHRVLTACLPCIRASKSRPYAPRASASTPTRSRSRTRNALALKAPMPRLSASAGCAARATSASPRRICSTS